MGQREAMRLPDAIYQRLASEYTFIAEQVAQAETLPQRLYMFSAFFGEAGRLLNQAWDEDLILIHQVTQKTHELINGRVASLRSGERAIGIPSEISEALTEVSHSLADWVTNDSQNSAALVPILSRLAAIGYSTTGNGYYLYLKEHFTLSPTEQRRRS